MNFSRPCGQPPIPKTSSKRCFKAALASNQQPGRGRCRVRAKSGSRASKIETFCRCKRKVHICQWKATKRRSWTRTIDTTQLLCGSLP